MDQWAMKIYKERAEWGTFPATWFLVICSFLQSAKDSGQQSSGCMSEECLPWQLAKWRATLLRNQAADVGDFESSGRNRSPSPSVSWWVDAGKYGNRSLLSFHSVFLYFFQMEGIDFMLLADFKNYIYPCNTAQNMMHNKSSHMPPSRQ